MNISVIPSYIGSITKTNRPEMNILHSLTNKKNTVLRKTVIFITHENMKLCSQTNNITYFSDIGQSD